MRLLVVIDETTKITSDGNCLFQSSIMDYVHTPNTVRETEENIGVHVTTKIKWNLRK